MIVRHELTMRRSCPVNGGRDTYQVTIESTRLIHVETILAAVSVIPETTFQEDATEALASSLDCTVTTVGYHSGVKTTCTA